MKKSFRCTNAYMGSLAEKMAPFVQQHNDCSYEDANRASYTAYERYWELIFRNPGFGWEADAPVLGDIPVLEFECRDGCVIEIGTAKADAIGPIKYYFSSPIHEGQFGDF